MILDGGPGGPEIVTDKICCFFRKIKNIILAAIRFVLYILDVRKRHWFLAAVTFYGALTCAVLIGLSAYKMELMLFDSRLQVTSIRNSEKTLASAARTLVVAYGLTEQTSEVYARLYCTAARKYGIPWEAFAATTYIESHFEAMAKSPSGACGLMQLLESTAEGECRKLKIPYRKNSTVWNIILNIHLGCSYFSECYSNNIPDLRDCLKEAFKRYLGGSKYRNYPNQELIIKYCDDVLREYDKLTYIYQGALGSYK